MTDEHYARKLKSRYHPYLLEVNTVNIIKDGTRNDQIDIGLSELKSFSTCGDVHGIKSVLFSFDGGIVRVHFPKSKVFNKAFLEIAENMEHNIMLEMIKNNTEAEKTNPFSLGELSLLGQARETGDVEFLKSWSELAVRYYEWEKNRLMSKHSGMLKK